MIDNNIYKLKYILKDCYFKFKNNQHIYILSSFSSVLNKGSTYSIKYLNRKDKTFYIQDYKIEYDLVNDLEILI